MLFTFADHELFILGTLTHKHGVLLCTLLHQLFFNSLYLLFLFLNEHALHVLILGIFAHIAVAAQSLGEVVGGEDEKQFVL